MMTQIIRNFVMILLVVVGVGIGFHSIWLAIAAGVFAAALYNIEYYLSKIAEK